MSIPARFIPSVLTLALALTWNAGRASGQAMVSYGHGVAKAAGAGAAVGGGVGGVLTGLGNPLSSAAGRRGGTSKGSVTVQRQTVPVRRDAVTWDVPRQGFGTPAPLPLIGGVRANGATDPNWQPTLLEPSQNLAVISASWGGPSDAEAEASTEVADAEQPPAGIDAEVAAEPKQNLPIVVRSSGQGGAAAGKRAEAQLGSAAPVAIPEGVEVGASIDELLKKLGRPYLSVRGIAGEGYTDQYVFQLPDGGHLVIYVLDGLVAHVSVG
jgi:hypothetical protein